MAPGVLKRLFKCSAGRGNGRGLVKVWVGKETQRQCKFEIKLNYLSHPLFLDLLSYSMEEFGCSYDGAVRIACEIDAFLRIVWLLESGHPSAHYVNLRDIMEASGTDIGGAWRDRILCA